MTTAIKLGNLKENRDKLLKDLLSQEHSTELIYSSMSDEFFPRVNNTDGILFIGSPGTGMGLFPINKPLPKGVIYDAIGDEHFCFKLGEKENLHPCILPNCNKCSNVDISCTGIPSGSRFLSPSAPTQYKKRRFIPEFLIPKVNSIDGIIRVGQRCEGPGLFIENMFKNIVVKIRKRGN